MEDVFSKAPASPPSLRHKLKQSLCFSCCFPRRNHHHLHSPLSDENPTLIWVKSRGPRDQHSLSDLKEKCRTILGISKHKRHFSPADFRYDPLSYALNFEDRFGSDDEEPLKNFSARLPPSPPEAAAVS